MLSRTKCFLLVSVAAVALAIAAGLAGSSAGAEDPLPYEDPSLPVGERVDDLLSRLTLEE